MAKTKLRDDGSCSICGEARLLLAEDMTRYTPVTKDAEYGWQAEGSHLEDMDSGNPDGDVRLFCPQCGTHFEVPPEVSDWSKL